ncbi:hypothetical protein KIW84_052165 [Lathyrus oleraceus]|uniref:Uncharacterized protein n=1 Tax=Pisum sativum TaxID=3888 RepID=A0A9D5AEK2_PEA|nr:hypothetical protein KIW84_052165 [Pisum sativum]
MLTKLYCSLAVTIYRFVKIRNARESFTSHKAICGALLAWQLRDSSELEEFDETLVHFIYSASIGLNHEGEKRFRFSTVFNTASATKFANNGPVFLQGHTQFKGSNQTSHSKITGRTMDSHDNHSSSITSKTATAKNNKGYWLMVTCRGLVRHFQSVMQKS